MGAGSSLESGAPSVFDLKKHLAEKFSIDYNSFSLSEIATIIESKKADRKTLITLLREKISKARARGAILNIPNYDWKSIYTTNYDQVIEQAYERAGRDLKVYSGNVDFTGDEVPEAAKLFKLHGDIQKDSVDGYIAKLIVSDQDYDDASEFREYLFDRLKADIAGADVFIIGYSLNDRHIQEIIQRTIDLNKLKFAKTITIVVYEKSEDRASLYEARGLKVCFGGLDEFFSAVATVGPEATPVFEYSGKILDRYPELRPVTKEVEEYLEPDFDISQMFNGWPAGYSEIEAGLTFRRSIEEKVINFLLNHVSCIILGASGLGKTTLARKIVLHFHHAGFRVWEHNSDRTLQSKSWIGIAKDLEKEKVNGILFVDNLHLHIQEFNEIIDYLVYNNNEFLKIIGTSGKNQWLPRVKTPSFYVRGREFFLRKLDDGEIEALLTLVENKSVFHPLIEDQFSGFSRNERKRRLVVRCESETFVCLRNIFSSERFDDIILREFASLNEDSQQIYKLVAAMENSGIRVHRQLVMRLLGIDANQVAQVLMHLEGIVEEYDINKKEGVFGWRGRHPVIVEIITKYKFNEIEEKISLLEKVIRGISPTYEIEVRSIRELCNVDTGVPSIPDKRIQNKLLREMISVAPGERVPRHRLVRNLIDIEEFEKAETEIRVFEKDFRSDGPMARYKLALMIARGVKTPGLMIEDRNAILQRAESFVASVLQRYRGNKHFLKEYAELGLAVFKLTKSSDCFSSAMRELKNAEVQLGDPDVSRIVRKLETRFSQGNI